MNNIRVLNPPKNPFSQIYFPNEEIQLEKLLADCPPEFNNTKNTFRSFMLCCLRLRGHSSKWSWKTNNKPTRAQQFSAFNQALVLARKLPACKESTASPDVLSVIAWILASMLDRAPTFFLREEACEA